MKTKNNSEIRDLDFDSIQRLIEIVRKETKKKPLWKSKTLWTNALILVSSLTEAGANFLLTEPVTSISMVALLNLALRVVTDSELVFKEEEEK